MVTHPVPPVDGPACESCEVAPAEVLVVWTEENDGSRHGLRACIPCAADGARTGLVRMVTAVAS